jgi:hypothetical protein
LDGGKLPTMTSQLQRAGSVEHFAKPIAVVRGMMGIASASLWEPQRTRSLHPS